MFDSRQCLRFHRREHHEEKRDGRSVVEEAFAFEDEVEPPGDSKLFEDRKYRRGIGGRYYRAEKERDFKRDVDSEKQESVTKGHRYGERRYDERNDREKRNGTDVPEQILVPEIVRRFEQQDRKENVKQDFRSEFERVEKFRETEFGRERDGYSRSNEGDRGGKFRAVREIGNPRRDDEERNERKGGKEKWRHARILPIPVRAASRLYRSSPK